MQETNDSLSFDEWYAKVDESCREQIGLGVGDLVDADSYSMYAAGMEPHEAAKEIIANDDIVADVMEVLGEEE